jgi:integrase
MPRNARRLTDPELIATMLTEWEATPRTRDGARYTLVAFAAWLAGHDAELATATPELCRAWLDERKATVAASTVVRNWSQLRAFYAHCTDDDDDAPLLDIANPMRRIKMPRAPKWAVTHAATVAEVDAVLATFDARSMLGLRNRIAVSLMFHSGLRVSEVGRIDLADIDLDGRSIVLPETKNGQPRIPPIHPTTYRMIVRYLTMRGDRPGPLLWNTGNRRASNRLTTNALQNVIKDAAAATDLAVTPHSLRRGFVVAYIANGGSTAACMIIGGWESETMIVRYLADARAGTAQVDFNAVAARQIAAAKADRQLPRSRRLRVVG